MSWDVELYGELLKIGGGKERLINTLLLSFICWPAKILAIHLHSSIQTGVSSKHVLKM